MKKLLWFSILILLPGFSNLLLSQTRSGAFTVTGSGYSSAVVSDYQCVGINPANLGWNANNHLVNLGLGEANLSVYSEPLKRTLVNELFSSSVQFTKEDKEMAVQDFTDTKLQFEGTVTGIGFSVQNSLLGGIGFAVKERIMWDSYLNEHAADILFNGYHSAYFDTIVQDIQTGDSIGIAFDPESISRLFENTHLQMSWFREYNLSYGRRVFKTDKLSLFAGIGLKYLQGYSAFNYSYKNGVIKAFSALNPLFDVNYDTYSPSKIADNSYQAIGKGYGVDLGVSALLFNKLRLALAITDLGSIKWDGNVYEGENAVLKDIETAGLDNYNIFSLDDNVAFGNLKWGGWNGLESKTTQLPTNLRFGGAYLLLNKFEFGADLYIPFNDAPGSYDKAIVGLGTRISPIKWFRGSIGLVTGGETGTNIPVGFSFFPAQ